ncbi:MAG TPA: 2,3-bisphosphoglycerate-independent phosphoglycerate mutase [Desulfotomaculum sp.]|nr:2,3-bisphosphoglycerate-independent phosphoglycerate mutase [Desulfotomaculum sp.]
MDMEKLLQELVQPAKTKMLLVVLDGLGGLPVPEFNEKTELGAARKPNLDSLARRSELGLAHPVLPGITPGSSAGHLALFGYDPIKYVIGRGILEALGIDFPLEPQDIAIRANLATVRYESGGMILADRRAGRPATEVTREICARLQEAVPEIEGVRVLFRPVKEHRFVIVLRGEGLDDRVADTDPQAVGVPPLPPRPLTPEAERTAAVAAKLLHRIAALLRAEPAANFALLRGFSRRPKITLFPDRFKLRAGAIALYPMYRGLASLVGMEVLPVSGNTIAAEADALKEHWGEYDFFFFHVKATDSRGEDGDWKGKSGVIEEFDRFLPALLELKPDAIAITGDHSTPAVSKGHSWHPVPFLLHSPWVRFDGNVSGFDEYVCAKGALGHFPLHYTMSLLLANAGRLSKFSA